MVINVLFVEWKWRVRMECLLLVPSSSNPCSLRTNISETSFLPNVFIPSSLFIFSSLFFFSLLYLLIFYLSFVLVISYFLSLLLIIVKVINGERAAYHAPAFRPKITRTRSQILKSCGEALHSDNSKKPLRNSGSLPSSPRSPASSPGSAKSMLFKIIKKESKKR